MTKLRNQGSLGTAPITWLNENGVAASGEGEVVRSSKTQMAARTWNDGKEDRQFNLHLKPVEAAAPNRCVRIYFDFDDESGKTVVGWVRTSSGIACGLRRLPQQRQFPTNCPARPGEADSARIHRVGGVG